MAKVIGCMMTILCCTASANYASNNFFGKRWKFCSLWQNYVSNYAIKAKIPSGSLCNGESLSTLKRILNILASKSTCFIFLSFINFIAFMIAGLSQFRGWIFGMWIPFYLANAQCLCTHHRGRGQLHCGRQAVWLHVRLEQAAQSKWRLQRECQRGIWREDHS